MTRRVTRSRMFCALFASLALLGAASKSSGSMYLRAPNLHTAPVVQSLKYDAIATIPARANTPASLLPPDRVEGAMILPAAENAPSVSRSTFRGITTFTVVQLNERGAVVQRTLFSGVSVRSVDFVGGGNGSMVQRVNFDAAKVVVTNPHR